MNTDAVAAAIYEPVKCNLYTDKKWKASIMRLFLSQ